MVDMPEDTQELAILCRARPMTDTIETQELTATANRSVQSYMEQAQ